MAVSRDSEHGSESNLIRLAAMQQHSRPSEVHSSTHHHSGARRYNGGVHAFVAHIEGRTRTGADLIRSGLRGGEIHGTSVTWLPLPLSPSAHPMPLFGPTMPAAWPVVSIFVTPITEPPRFFSTFVLSRVWAQVAGVPCRRSVPLGFLGGGPSGGGVLNPAWSGHSPTRRLAPWRTPV